MKITILFFGITADLIRETKQELVLEKSIVVGAFKLILKEKFPQLKNIDSYAVAVNEIYAEDAFILQKGDVVAIIPPVSGG
jgi:molybdopterin converting factor subunit 1